MALAEGSGRQRLDNWQPPDPEAKERSRTTFQAIMGLCADVRRSSEPRWSNKNLDGHSVIFRPGPWVKYHRTVVGRSRILRVYCVDEVVGVSYSENQPDSITDVFRFPYTEGVARLVVNEASRFFA